MQIESQAREAFAEEPRLVWANGPTAAKALKTLAEFIDKEYGDTSITGVSISLVADSGSYEWVAETSVY